MKWFTSDLHLGHEAIIEYCNRPFKNAHKMDTSLIKNINELVSVNDELFILGDLSIRSRNHKGYYEQVLDKLQCKKIVLILGNHDIKDPWFYCDIGIHSVHVPYLKVEEFYCIHDPALSQVSRESKFLCGHIHDLFIMDKNCLNVGVDVHNFAPISINQVREFFKD